MGSSVLSQCCELPTTLFLYTCQTCKNLKPASWTIWPYRPLLLLYKLDDGSCQCTHVNAIALLHHGKLHHIVHAHVYRQSKIKAHRTCNLKRQHQTGQVSHVSCRQTLCIQSAQKNCRCQNCHEAAATENMSDAYLPPDRCTCSCTETSQGNQMLNVSSSSHKSYTAPSRLHNKLPSKLHSKEGPSAARTVSLDSRAGSRGWTSHDNSNSIDCSMLLLWLHAHATSVQRLQAA